MVAYVQQKGEDVAFQPPDDADIHVDAALEKPCTALDAFDAQGWMKRVFGQQAELVLHLLFLLRGQGLEVLFKAGG